VRRQEGRCDLICKVIWDLVGDKMVLSENGRSMGAKRKAMIMEKAPKRYTREGRHPIESRDDCCF
jgi:hypothetical protein